MWFDGERKENTLYVACVSRGKDSTAMLRAIRLMDWPLDAIMSTDIWFDDDTPAELPDMVAFKDKWDKKCFENFGIEVTRVCALTTIDKKRKTESCYEKYDGTDKYKLTYCDIFYRRVSAERERVRERTFTKGRNFKTDVSTMGFPLAFGSWCRSELKTGAFTRSRIIKSSGVQESLKALISENF